jgi:hypothetical protein
METNVTCRGLGIQGNQLADPSEEKKRLAHYLNLNKAGRQLLQQDDKVPHGLWAQVLSKSTKKPDMIYRLLLGKPDLICTIAECTVRTT